MRRLPLALLLFSLSVAPLVAQRARGTAPAADLDAYIARALRTFDVPGMAVTIVKDGKVLLAKGYGVRRLGDTAPVDADTRFGIGDNTKKLVLKMDATPGMIADVTHFERDVFSVHWRDRTLKADAYLWFQLDRDGDIELARMEAQSYDVRRSFNFQDLQLRPARAGLRRRP
jgi:Beta-lactamase/Domain of unknown function (DUF3471)